jgi:hypothetical protein
MGMFITDNTTFILKYFKKSYGEGEILISTG